jgi:cell division protein FtsW (lipid II flippase)
MRRSGVSSAIWGQQLAAGLTLLILCLGWSMARRTTSRSRPEAWPIFASAALLLLASTLLHPGIDGVHRWVSLGPLQLHAAFLALPALLIGLCATPGRQSSRAAWLFFCVAGLAAVILALQPDASQASAFAVAVAVILLQRKPAHVSEWVAGGFVAGCAVLAWSRHDPLEAVTHVEGIVSLAAGLGAAWLIAALLALALLPVPFIAEAWRRREPQPAGFALAAYFGVVCIAPFIGPYPVPVLGYGLSPIMGYFAALGWIMTSAGAPRAARLELKSERG